MKISRLLAILKKNARFIILIMFLLLTQGACAGVRYSEVSPEAKGFHPKRIGVLPSDFGTYEEAKDVIDRIFMEALVEKRWFSDVIAADSMANRMQSSAELRKLVTDYIAKLKTLNYSDPDLSKKIGDLLNIDAFFIITVDYWNYTAEDDKKIARVGLSLKMINAATGKLVWRAGHQESEIYRIMKPKLSDVAATVAKKLINEMPR